MMKFTPPKLRQKLTRLGTAGATLLISVTVLGFAPEKGVDPLQAPTRQIYKNWGLTNTTAKSHIDAPDAWKIEEGDPNIVVAVIDTGIDASHPSLKKNIWHSGLTKILNAPMKLVKSTLKVFRKKDHHQEAGMIPESEFLPQQEQAAPDEDFGDHEYGWNFVTNKANPNDEHGHGTHVAGIIGAVADPKSGVSGVAHNVSIMSVKYYSDANPGSVNLKNTVRAINYAVDHGARIINYSGGGPEFSEDEYLAIKKAESKGILFVAAAGNEHQNTDLQENYYYPSAYRLSNILSVAATDIHNNLLATSNWGKKRVDVAAPGENIYSTLPGGRYGYMSGTSQATAFVSGLAALLLSQDSSLTPVQLKEIIMSSVDRFPQLENKLATGGRVNAYAALMALKSGPRYKTRPILARPANGMSELTRAPGGNDFMGPPAPEN
jgi:subtilisin family serine protease